MSNFASQQCAWWKFSHTAFDLPVPGHGRKLVYVIYDGETHVYEISPEERLAFLRWVAMAFPVDLPDRSIKPLDAYMLEKLLGDVSISIIEP
jgi:hypothetical protein